MGFSRNILPGLNAKYAYITRMLSVLRDYSGGSAKADIPADEELIGCSLYVGIDSWGGSRPSLILYSPTGDVRITNTTNHYQKTWNIAELYPDKVFTGVYVECWRQNDVNKSYVICTYVTRKKIGGGSLYYKLFKNPFVKGFFIPSNSGKRWNLMGFCRNILPGGKSPFPGYVLHFAEGQHPTIKGSINTVVTWDNKKIIPLMISGTVNGGWRENRYAHFDLYLNNINTVGVYDCRPMTSYSAGSVSINMSINLLLYRTIEELKSINTIKFNRTDGDVGFTWYCTMWLEKVGA